VSPLQSQHELFALWSAARAEANFAYDAWCSAPGRESYIIYRAAEDRADAAEQNLADRAWDVVLAAT
jgi:hypothetical protein